MRYFIIRKRGDEQGAAVEVSEDLWLRVGQMVAEEIKRGRAHFIAPSKRDQPEMRR